MPSAQSKKSQQAGVESAQVRINKPSLLFAVAAGRDCSIALQTSGKGTLYGTYDGTVWYGCFAVGELSTHVYTRPGTTRLLLWRSLLSRDCAFITAAGHSSLGVGTSGQLGLGKELGGPGAAIINRRPTCPSGRLDRVAHVCCGDAHTVA